MRGTEACADEKGSEGITASCASKSRFVMKAQI